MTKIEKEKVCRSKEKRSRGMEKRRSAEYREKKRCKKWQQLRGHKYKRCYTFLLFDWSSLRRASCILMTIRNAGETIE